LEVTSSVGACVLLFYQNTQGWSALWKKKKTLFF